MTTRHSHGSARTELPRSSELATPDAAGEPSGMRDARGRFAA